MSCNAKKDPKGTWRIQYRWTDWTGTKKKSQKRGFKTKKEAEEWYAHFMLQQSSDPTMTLADFWEIYKADMEKRLRKTTMKQKEYVMKDKVLPYFGKTPINEITAPMIRKWQGEMMEKGFKPTYLKTIHNQLTVLNAALTLSDVDDEKKLECNNVIVEWLERTAESPNEKVRISSIFMLAAKYIQMEKYKEANIFLDKIPDTVIDATIMKTNVLAHQEGTDIAAFFLEGKLMQTVTNIQNYLYKLIEMEEETGNHCKAEEIAEITEHMVSLFGLWDYGKVVPYLLIAVYRKDVEKCIQLIKEVLMESQKPWKMVESPLYYRYVDTVQGKSFSGVGNNFVHALATEIENKEEYEFLKGNKELEAIFSQYLK